VLFDKIASVASAGNRHCANCIGALSFPIVDIRLCPRFDGATAGSVYIRLGTAAMRPLATVSVTPCYCYCYSINTVRQRKRSQFSFVCLFFNARQKLVNFFTYIKESISYNSVYLVLACVKNFV